MKQGWHPIQQIETHVDLAQLVRTHSMTTTLHSWSVLTSQTPAPKRLVRILEVQTQTTYLIWIRWINRI